MLKVDLQHAKLKEGTVSEEIHDKVWTPDEWNAWLELPNVMDTNEIKKTAKEVRGKCDVLAVIGIGGSYLGALAGLQMLGGDFPIEFLGTSFDPTPVHRFLEKYKGKRIAINVISKSGNTLEISSVFEILKSYASEIIITTDANKGYFRDMVNREGYKAFIVPDGVGGRYSVLSAVGLLPLAVAGINIDKILDGAQKAYKDLQKKDNEAYKYAIARNDLHKCKSVEVLASFYEGFDAFGRWWQQLFGESEGKESKGIFPVFMVYSRELHSMGQYIQEGSPIFFETMINIVNPPTDLNGLNRLNDAAFKGTLKAHAANAPVVVLHLDKLDEASFGYLVFFMKVACATSAYILGVNPFDQPGVELYKKEMREILK